MYLSFDGRILGHFLVNNDYRKGMKDMAAQLRRDDYGVLVLSGDNDLEKNNLAAIFGSDTQFYFRKNPQEKLDYIEALQSEGKHVLNAGRRTE